MIASVAGAVTNRYLGGRMSYSYSKRRYFAALVAMTGGLAMAADTVNVPGTSAHYPTRIEVQAAGKPVHLTLTGAALRKKAFFSVYTVASYLQEGVAAKSADQLAA